MRKTWLYAFLMILWALCLIAGESYANVMVSQAEIHAAVTSYVEDMLSDFDGEVDVTIRHKGDLRVEGVGAVKLRVRPDRFRSHARSLPVVLEVVRGPVVIREYSMIAQVRYFDDVVISTRPIERGEPISEDAITTERREVTTILGRYISQVSELENCRAKMKIGLGRPLSFRYLETTPVVERGDMVRIRAKIGGIVATAVGIARESGAKGDRIVVQNTSSREKLMAEVVAPGTVQIVF